MRATPAFLSFVWLATFAATATAQTAPPPAAPSPAPGVAPAPSPAAAPAPAPVELEATTVAPAPPPPPPPPLPAAPPPGPPPVYRAAPVAPAAPGVHTHDGFFLRAQLGAASTTFTVQSTPGSISSGGAAFNLQIGGALTPHVLLFGEIFGTGANKFTAEGAPMATVDNAQAGAGVAGIGIGSAYCFMPVNVCLTGTLGSASIAFTGVLANGSHKSTDSGGVLKLAASKEWWVSDDFALGVAAQYLTTGAMRDTEMYGSVANPTWHASAFGLLFSATYN